MYLDNSANKRKEIFLPIPNDPSIKIASLPRITSKTSFETVVVG
jgi:hypothetical protein